MKTLFDSRRPLGRLFLCLLSLLIAALAARASGPSTTVVQEGLFGAKSGAEKKQSALSFVGAAISLSEAVSNRDILDADKFRSGLSKIIDGTVECLNASTWAKQ